MWLFLLGLAVGLSAVPGPLSVTAMLRYVTARKVFIGIAIVCGEFSCLCCGKN